MLTLHLYFILWFSLMISLWIFRIKHSSSCLSWSLEEEKTLLRSIWDCFSGLTQYIWPRLASALVNRAILRDWQPRSSNQEPRCTAGPAPSPNPLSFPFATASWPTPFTLCNLTGPGLQRQHYGSLFCRFLSFTTQSANSTFYTPRRQASSCRV